MRLKLDENFGRRGTEILAAAGHEVATVPAVPLTRQDAFEAPPLRPHRRADIDERLLRRRHGEICRTYFNRSGLNTSLAEP